MAVKNDDSTKDLSTLLNTVVLQKNWQNRMGVHQVFLFWNDMFGELSQHAQPETIRGDILWIGVCDSVWMQQLQFEKQTMLDQINKRIGTYFANNQKEKLPVATCFIKDIKFKPAPELSTAQAFPTPLRTRSREDSEQSARHDAFKSALRTIDDIEIKNSLHNLWRALEGRNDKKR